MHASVAFSPQVWTVLHSTESGLLVTTVRHTCTVAALPDPATDATAAAHQHDTMKRRS